MLSHHCDANDNYCCMCVCGGGEEESIQIFFYLIVLDPLFKNVISQEILLFVYLVARRPAVGSEFICALAVCK